MPRSPRWSVRRTLTGPPRPEQRRERSIGAELHGYRAGRGAGRDAEALEATGEAGVGNLRRVSRGRIGRAVKVSFESTVSIRRAGQQQGLQASFKRGRSCRARFASVHPDAKFVEFDAEFDQGVAGSDIGLRDRNTALLER